MSSAPLRRSRRGHASEEDEPAGGKELSAQGQAGRGEKPAATAKPAAPSTPTHRHTRARTLEATDVAEQTSPEITVLEGATTPVLPQPTTRVRACKKKSTSATSTKSTSKLASHAAPLPTIAETTETIAAQSPVLRYTLWRKGKLV
jgi:hypothetical protein